MNTLSEAREYAENGKIDEWVQLFLRGEGKNIGLAEGLLLEQRYYYGPINIELSLIEVKSGPGFDHHTENDIKWFYYVVDEMKKAYDKGWDMPPLIVQYDDGKFEINDGVHRYRALQQLGITEFYAVIWITGKQDYERFMKQYHKE